MKARRVLCEGRDDVAAIRAIGEAVFHARCIEPTNKNHPAGRLQNLQVGESVRIRVEAPTGGKDALPATAAAILDEMPPDATDSELALLALVYDPNGEGRQAFCDRVTKAIEKDRTWRIEGRLQSDAVAKASATCSLQIRCIAWRDSDPITDANAALGASEENLERFLCAVAAKRYPEHKPMIARMLADISVLEHPKRWKYWKAALHLWCAVVVPRSSAENVAAEFLQQDEVSTPHVRAVLQEAGLETHFAALFSPE